MTYHGGEVFGQAHNDSSKLARTVLAVMLKCLFGGPTFIVKMLPVCKLDSKYQFTVVSSVIDAISAADGRLVAILCDNNKVNQRFYQLFNVVPDKPWLAVDGTFLLYDYVHIWKNVRNNWLTEK